MPNLSCSNKKKLLDGALGQVDQRINIKSLNDLGLIDLSVNKRTTVSELGNIDQTGNKKSLVELGNIDQTENKKTISELGDIGNQSQTNPVLKEGDLGVGYEKC